MNLIKNKIIKFSINNKIFKFGNFILKSGRNSPYFFNSGLFNTGKNLIMLGNFYANAIKNSDINYNLLFGAAYKGIPIVTATTISLANKYKINVPYCFNRKENKKHGEKGNIIGQKLIKRKVILIDDVITSGSTIKDSIKTILKHKAKLTGICIFFDRQEKEKSNINIIKKIKKQYSCKIIKIITLTDLINYLEIQPNMKNQLTNIKKYQKKYGS